MFNIMFKKPAVDSPELAKARERRAFDQMLEAVNGAILDGDGRELAKALAPLELMAARHYRTTFRPIDNANVKLVDGRTLGELVEPVREGYDLVRTSRAYVKELNGDIEAANEKIADIERKEVEPLKERIAAAEAELPDANEKLAKAEAELAAFEKRIGLAD